MSFTRVTLIFATIFLASFPNDSNCNSLILQQKVKIIKEPWTIKFSDSASQSKKLWLWSHLDKSKSSGKYERRDASDVSAATANFEKGLCEHLAQVAIMTDANLHSLTSTTKIPSELNGKNDSEFDNELKACIGLFEENNLSPLLIPRPDN